MEQHKKKITQAFILGAGLGTRLRPLTDTMPKVMVPINKEGKPLLEHSIEWLRDHGITDFVINLHCLPDVITSHFGDGKKWGVHIAYSDETDQLFETGGAFWKAAPLLQDQFLFMYGDELHFIDPHPLIESHFERDDALATIVLKTSDIPSNGEIADFDAATRRITRWQTRPHAVTEYTATSMLNAGLYAFSKKILNYIPPATPIKLDGEVIPRAFAAHETLYAFPTNESILDIGTPEKYEIAKQYYRECTAEKAI
ncbi:MAG: nucleotidyltransferase family protein [Minisyncoccia bacterium]|jgi:NDP-sugar pyrophosphorylase family protein